MVEVFLIGLKCWLKSIFMKRATKEDVKECSLEIKKSLEKHYKI